MKDIKLSYGMIVFNALSVLPKGMLAACINNIYDEAHEILISEGAVRPAGGNPGNATWASKDGRSTDGTLEFLQSFPDPDKKIKIFTKEGNYWDGKLEMCNAYLEGYTGDYLLQVDSDEFFQKNDIRKIKWILSNDSDIVRVDFFANLFFGDYNHCCDFTQKGWSNQIPWMRIFKCEKGAKWISHAPPIMSDKKGKPQKGKILNREETLLMGITLQHYAYVTRTQAEFKDKYYNKNFYVKTWDRIQKNKDIMLVNGDKVSRYIGMHCSEIEGNKNGTNK